MVERSAVNEIGNECSNKGSTKYPPVRSYELLLLESLKKTLQYTHDDTFLKPCANCQQISNASTRKAQYVE